MNMITYQWITVVLSVIATAFTVINVLKDCKKRNAINDHSLTNTSIGTPRKEIEKLRKLSFNSIIMMLIVISLAGVVCWQFYSKKHPIVFAGGGSVMNYLADRIGVDFREQNNSISIALASGTSWSLLNEKQHANKESNKNIGGYETFTPVCLSAGEMSDDFKAEYFSKMNDAIIVEVFLGYDTLVTYVSHKTKENRWGMKDYNIIIRSDILYNGIKEIVSDSTINKKRDIRIFTTNKTSGTLELYKKYLPELYLEKMIDKDEAQIFYDNFDSEIIEYYYDEDKLRHDREYIILGSQNYTVKNVGVPLKVVDTAGDYILKPLYLYFLADKIPNSNYYKIDKRVLRILRETEKGMLEKNIITQDTAWKNIKDNKKIFFNSDNNTFPKTKTIIFDPSYKKE